MATIRFCRPADLPGVSAAPGIRRRVFAGERMMLALFEFEPDTELPVHSHPHEQVGYVLAGSLQIGAGDATCRLGPGDVYVAPPNAPHAAVSGPDGATVLDVFSPPREDFV